MNGRAEKEITPDEFYLSIVINERDSKGKISVESQQRDMIAALKRLGVNVEKQLKVANLSSEFFKKNTSVATAKYQLQLGSSAEVAKVWQALDGLGISNVSILKVSHSKIDEYKEQVRVEAMQNAKQSAQTLAGAIGQNVGKCFYIYDSNNNVMPVFYDNMAVMRSAKAGYGRGRGGRTARLQDHQAAVQRAGEIRAGVALRRHMRRGCPAKGVLFVVSGCRGRRLSRFGFRIRGRSAEEGRAWSRTKPAGCEKRRRMVRIPKNYTIFVYFAP